MPKISSDNCRFFCSCSFFYVKEPPHRVIDFIYKKIGKPTLPKDMTLFLAPRAGYRFRVEALTGEARIRVRYSRGQLEEKIAEVKNYELSDSMKKGLLETEKMLPLWEKEYEKPDENHVFVMLKAQPKFTEEKSIRMDTLDKFLENKELRSILDLIEDIWPSLSI